MTAGIRIGTRRLILSTIVAFVAVAWISSSAHAQITPVVTGEDGVPQSTPIPAAQIPADITA
ncbi:MAG: hypothetical protein ACREQH_08720, partial [Candidatus Binatus sp.]